MFYDCLTENDAFDLQPQEMLVAQQYIQLFKLIRKFCSHMKMLAATTSNGRAIAINVVHLISLVTTYEETIPSELRPGQQINGNYSFRVYFLGDFAI